ncbi:MAG: hypothetical protein D3910_22325, partial [Candidatus Electrothrix sp. ATG2]|nr:hypothetical protein [Candidatus Electrothrix sp. ATG2]
MPHFFSINLRQGGRNHSCYFIYCVMLLILLSVSNKAVLSAEERPSTEQVLINGLSATPDGKNLRISIHCSSKAEYIPIELINSPEIHINIDVADAKIAAGVELALTPESYGVGVSSELIKNVTPELVRVAFTLAKKYQYSLDWNKNDLVLTLEDFFIEEQADPEKEIEPASPTAPEEKQSTSDSLPKHELNKEVGEQETIDSHLPDMSDVLGSVAGGGTETKKAENEEAGVPKPIGENGTISVDFYKIDLHNVFRMLREITGKNIVISEGVSGNLTLALTDVPWRFVLDIILNLKDLAKEERDNTIVIYPKDKEFVFPKQEDEGLTLTPDEGIIEEQKKKGITYTGERNIPPEQLEAKKILASGRAAERKGDLETAVRFYEQALEKWPENSKLANKISALYL